MCQFQKTSSELRRWRRAGTSHQGDDITMKPKNQDVRSLTTSLEHTNEEISTIGPNNCDTIRFFASEASYVCWILKFKKSASEVNFKTQTVSQFLGVRWKSNDNHTLVRYLLLWRTKFLEFVSHCFWMMIALLQFQFFDDICEGGSFLPDHKCKKLQKLQTIMKTWDTCKYNRGSSRALRGRVHTSREIQGFILIFHKRKLGWIHNKEDFEIFDTELKNGSYVLISLKYKGKLREPVICKIERISKPGLRVYANTKKLPKVLNGLGIAIISTSKGIMTNLKAKEFGIGGEVLCYIW